MNSNNLHSLSDAFFKVLDYIVWEFEAYEVTIRKIIIAIIVFFAFYLIARLIQKILLNKFVSKKIFHEHALLAINRIVMCFFLICGFFFALRIIHIPLSAFAFLGGSLAIGVGFGAKQIISNLISGFIIMFEKPIKLGDFVEFDGETGNIVDIGVRCTRIRTVNNLEILVPNSNVIENKVANWSSLKGNIRTKVSIGIGYSSDIHKATDLMLNAVNKSSNVLSTPAPFVIFKEHGDSTLNFDIYFTVHAKNNIQKLKCESEVNYNLNDILRAGGIEIAFPQRDVHLDSTIPLDIKLVK